MRVVNESLLSEFRTAPRCEICGRRVYPLQPDHYRCRGMGGGSRLDIRINIAALCPPCHTEYQEAPRWKRRKVLEVIAKREKTTPEDIEAVVNFILRLPKGAAKPTFSYTHFSSYLLFKKTWKEITDGQAEPASRCTAGRHKKKPER
jgi:hypothetical protein